ncbi:hypothetical protein FDB14_18490 [Clostridium botulinum]|uniref:Uncharacterized protein n=1 Tax=Clostridium botulinum TaxID=1491 RepID=A0A0A0UVF3_CLOBO|nr:hypothetical protein [Clostridium botulinum]AIW54799.1 hypothetical protein [Clostridium botulinum]NFK66466.1 hypothetical protein [Clostridium botulinum]NFK69475.1 hypothetical protein [Clostridium botulinum]NFK98142.1 hypothetical protein [Clostridium botulinum]NFL39272.1 hypothetical protein [Clostridium botulinum]
MNKKNIIIVALLISFIFSFIYVGSKIFKKNDTNNDIATTNNVNEVKKNNINKEDIDEKESTESDLDKKIPVESGFKTTITGGDNEQEVIENNILLDNNSTSIQNKLEAKRVAENFVQAIVSFDINDKDGTVEKATKYVCKNKIDEVRSLYTNIGKSQDMKKTIITDLYSEEENKQENNEYLYFYVAVDVDLIDNYDQQVKGTGETYLVKLLKEDGQYKIIEYYFDE